MSEPTWKPIPGHPGYEASSDGQLRSWRRYSNGRVLTPTLESNGYYKQRLQTASSSQWVHRLVALAFLGPRPYDMEIRHLDGNPLNNAADNLAYGTRSENIYDQVGHGTHAAASKTECAQGHPFDELNTRIAYDGRRICRTCRKRVRAENYRRTVAKRGAA